MIGVVDYLKSLKVVIFFTILSVFLTCQLNSSSNPRGNLVLHEKSQPQGKIVFITGSCSSGKTSMAKILTEKLNARFFAFDKNVMPIVLKKFIKKHYGLFFGFFINKIIAGNFSNAVNLASQRRRYKMQMKFYIDLKQGMADEPTRMMFRKVRMLAEQGQNVVVESPIYLWDGVDFLHCLDVFDGVDVCYVLAYCPWKELVGRIKKRNFSSDKTTYRELNWAFINYVENFDVVTNRSKKNLPVARSRQGSLENLKGKDVYKDVTEYSKSKYKKSRLHLLPEVKKLVFKKFCKEKKYYIYPRFKYNIIVDTKVYRPEGGAKVVWEHVLKVSPIPKQIAK